MNQLEQIKSQLEKFNPIQLRTNLLRSFEVYKEIIETDLEPRHFWDMFHDAHAYKLGYYGYMEHEAIQNKVHEVLIDKADLPKDKLIDYILDVVSE
ncbi:hypothetical protein F7R25_03990 [Burkholderia stagnalis]|uniref:Uncharacterized protein n=1 Tax=Burkholderia stagnalis TaxID=1503054 RepID=A0A6L3N307_9BURK|nr:hypothetical protein [Burkholderia stagnalis]KAB0640665.1 hypothetical protein F7R25_03990 [Burkholderia stagnalis]VWB06217.1 hypothetical protein BST28156_00108 [Burkholderia stagnalis]